MAKAARDLVGRQRTAATGQHLPLDGGGWEGVRFSPHIGAKHPHP